METLGIPLKTGSKRSQVFIRKIDEGSKRTTAYVKIYANNRAAFQRLFRKSRSHIEAKNLCFFKASGISTPRIIAWGEERNRLGKVTRDFIITESIDQAVQLDDFIRERNTSVKDRVRLAKELGYWLRDIHHEGFYHKDIHWRNILVHMEKKGPSLYWIDCPRGSFHRLPPVRKHWRIKDCAILDKYASVLCSPVERLAFLSAYLGEHHRSTELQQFADQIVTYRRNRYDRRTGRTRVQPVNAGDAP
ncbi:MAG TPA: lipopolysaccharide kinase InaA family protein [Opitutales bacterium]|nr:lipopolysaccharide kinase InaA family protein [Opitutales bacterium]